MTLYNFMRFEPPSVRQNRLFETTRRLTGEVLQLTELQTNMERFREVESQQNLQFRQPFPGPTGLDEPFSRGTPRFVDPTDPFFVEAERERREAPAHDGLQLLTREPTGQGLAASALTTGFDIAEASDLPRRTFKQEVIDPAVPDFRLDVPVSREAVSQIPGPLGPLAATASTIERGVRGVTGHKTPIPDIIGNIPITSGLIEEAASWVLDPINVVFMAAPALKGAGGAVRVASRIRQTGRVPAFVKAAMKDVVRAGERGGPLRGGEPVNDSVLGKLRGAAEQAPENWLENARLSGQEFGERAARATKLRDDLIAQGVPEQEAILKSTAELRGEMPFKGVTGLDFSPQEEAWFWDQILGKVRYAEGVNVADAMQQMVRKMAAGVAPKDFPPFIWRIFGKAFGEDFTNQLKTVMVERIKAVKVVAEESAAERLAKAPTPKGVTDKTPLPPEFGGEQLPIRRVPGAPEAGPARTAEEAQQFRAEIELGQAGTPQGVTPGEALPPGADLGEQVPLQRTLEGLPEPSPQGTFTEQQQFRAEIELEASPKPKGVTPGEVADPTDAEQGILRDAAEQFPAPGIDLQGVKVADRETFLDILSNTVGVLKPLLSSMDISWFRQIAKSITRHPRTAFQSLRRGTTALWSKEKAIAWMDALKAEGSTTTGYRQLVIAEDGGTREIALGTLLEDRYMAVPGTPGFGQTSIASRPEFFISDVAQRLPGIRQSGRAFAVGWNTNYQGTARYWLDKLTKMNRGALTQKQVDASLNLQERITGVGKLGSDNSWFVKALKVLGFAPGYRVSGPEAFVTLLSPRTDPLIRRQAAEQLMSWALMGNGMLTALKYGAGATVVTTLGASQFGRVKFPGSDTWYNIWGTDNVLARSVLQAIQQQREDVKGNISVVGSGEKSPAGFLSSFTDAALGYLKSGESPVIGLFEELRTGETFIGEKLGWDAKSAWTVLRNRLPLVLQDFIDITETDGPLQTLFSVPGAITGITGITSYTPTREEFRTIPKYNSADKELIEGIIDRTLPEPLNLTANEERTILRFLRDDVREWIENIENQHGPIPSRISMEEIILKVAEEQGLSSRDKVGAVFLHKAKSNTDALNKEWIKFLLKNRPALEDYYPASYETDVIQAAQQRAEELGLVPVR